MTSSITQPYGFIHSNYASFMRMRILFMPYISLMNKKTSKESFTTIFGTVTIYMYHLTDNYGCHSDIVTETVTSKKWCSCVQNCTEHQSHTYTTMTVTKTKIEISLTQPNDVSLDCQVFRLPFWMAWAPDHPKMILGVHRVRMHVSKVSLDGFTIRRSRFSHPSLE